MARIRKIEKKPPKSARNYFLVDACFLANKYLPVGPFKGAEQDQIRAAHVWWKEIDRQTEEDESRVYIPDLCIAEAFKVLAKKYYQSTLLSAAQYKKARERLSADVSITHKALQAQSRRVKFHDVPASRDVLIATGRFYELFMKHGCNVGVVDLVLVSTAKYLMDFYDTPRRQLHIITHDNALWRGTKKVAELPNAYDPTQPKDLFSLVFK